MNQNKLIFSIILSIFFLIIVNNAFSQAPTITSQPSQMIKCISNSASISIEATGSEPITYEWYKDGIPTGTNSPTLDFPTLALSDAGIYTCVVSNGEGSVTSDNIEIYVVNGIPVINQVTTENSLVCLGTDNLIEVDYTGELSTITWFIGSDVMGYTSQHQLTNAQLSDEGLYFCEVSNVCGDAISNALDIDIVEHAEITTQPTTQTICEGEDAVFTATAEGDFLYYMWFADDSFIIGETSPSLTITSPTYPHSVEYKLVAYNVCNNDTSNGVYATVNTLPNITGQPIDGTECLGTEVTLIATATATTDCTYQWYDEANTLITDETNTHLTVALAANDSAHYYCAITNNCGTVYTDTAEIITLMAPVITQQPLGNTICIGDDITLQTKAIGSEPLNYQWLFNTSDVTGTNISGDETEFMTISSISEGQAGSYTCHVSNMCGFTITDVAEVIVNTPPVVTVQPEDLDVCEAEEMLIDINYAGTEPISFEWYIEETSTMIGSEEDFTALSDPDNSGSYYCILSNSCADISTDTVNIHIIALPEVTTHPEDESVCVGEYASMQIYANGEEPLDFLWYKNESPVSGQTNSTLEYPTAQVNQTGIYFCRVSNICGYDDSAEAELSIGTEPAITWNPIDQTICEHDTLNLIMDAQGENYTLQWYHNNSPISGENDTVLNIIYIDASMAGEYYCVASNSCATVYTDTIDVIINPAPVMSLGDDIDLCDGETTMLTAVGNYVHYNWNNGFSYQDTLSVQLGGTFVLEVTGENYCKTKDTIVVEYHPYHDILFDSGSFTSCGSFILDAGQGGYDYVWNTTPPQSTSSINITDPGTYAVTVSGDSHGCTTSESVIVEIKEPIDIDLGEDLTAPVSSFVDIGIEEAYPSYLWNTGFQGSILSIYGSSYGVGDHEFWLTATAENSCTATDTIIVTFWDDSSISDNSTEPLFVVYPNPTNGIINISSDDELISEIEIYNVIGELVETFAINSDNASLDLSVFAKGVYMIKAKCENNTFTKKILIK